MEFAGQNCGIHWSNVLLIETFITDWNKFPNISSFVTEKLIYIK